MIQRNPNVVKVFKFLLKSEITWTTPRKVASDDMVITCKDISESVEMLIGVFWIYAYVGGVRYNKESF